MKEVMRMVLRVAMSVVVLIAGLGVAIAQPGPGRGPGMGGPGSGMRGFGLARDFDRIDQNSDGKVTKDEVAGWFWERFSSADTNKDGAVTREELEAVRPAGREGAPDRGMRAGRGPGGEDRSGRGGPGQMRPGRGGSGAESFQNPPLAKTDEEKKILSVLEDMNENQRGGMMNVSPDDGRVLRLFAETVGAKHVVEIGTSNGYSGIWLCLALRGTGGKLTTYEINARRAALARENFKRAGVDKIVTLIEGDAHEEVPKMKESIDILFLDADKEGYIDYLNKLLPLVRPGGLVLAHNINPRQADPRYMEAITTNPDLETIFLNAQGSGISASLKKR